MTMRGLWQSLRALVRRRELEAELDEELRFHLELEIEERVRRGASPEEARTEALRAFGGVERFKEQCRDVRGVRWLEDLAQDVRVGLRSLRKAPVFTAVAILTLALGIGATTAIFSVVYAVLLRPLPYQEPERLVRLWSSWQGTEMGRVSPAEYLDYRARLESTVRLGVWSTNPASLTGEGEPERLEVASVSAGVLPALGVPAKLGRVFLEDEDAPGHRVAVLGHGLWQRRFGGRPDVLGRTLTLDGEPYTVVGVMPPGFALPDALDAAGGAALFIPLGLDASAVNMRGSHFLDAVARLRPGVSAGQADAAVRAVAEGFTREYADSYPERMRFSARAVGLREDLVGPVLPVLLLLGVAVGMVLLVVCANLANLLLARTEARQREVAIRVALGAGAGRLVRQLLAESLLLAGMGGAAGVALAAWGTDVLLTLAPTNVPRLAEAGVRPEVLLFSLGMTVLAGVAFGMAPALQASRAAPAGALRDGGRGSTAGRARQGLRRALVVSEVALAMVLVTGAGLLTRSLVHLLGVDPGYRTDGTLTVSLALPEATYGDNAKRVRFFQTLEARAGALPGVSAAGTVAGLPLASVRGDLAFTVEGRPVPPGEPKPNADWQVISPGYFRAMGMRLLRGREITERDLEDAPGVVVINEAFARRHFPGEEPLGKRFLLSAGAGPGWVTVVGVAADVRHAALDAAVHPEMYLSHAQFRLWGSGRALSSLTLVVRAKGEPASLAAPVRELLRAMDPDLPLGAVRTMEEVRAASVAGPRFILWMLMVFSGAALSIALVGVYGVMAYAVVQRTGEFGIRMALGALPRDILGMVMKQGMQLALVGISLGLGVALALGRLLSGLLYEVSPADPLTLAGVALALGAASLVACWVPARRATRVDPTEALRAG